MLRCSIETGLYFFSFFLFRQVLVMEINECPFFLLLRIEILLLKPRFQRRLTSLRISTFEFEEKIYLFWLVSVSTSSTDNLSNRLLHIKEAVCQATVSWRGDKETKHNNNNMTAAWSWRYTSLTGGHLPFPIYYGMLHLDQLCHIVSWVYTQSINNQKW